MRKSRKCKQAHSEEVGLKYKKNGEEINRKKTQMDVQVKDTYKNTLRIKAHKWTEKSIGKIAWRRTHHSFHKAGHTKCT